jgi:hypothetical protein
MDLSSTATGPSVFRERLRRWRRRKLVMKQANSRSGNLVVENTIEYNDLSIVITSRNFMKSTPRNRDLSKDLKAFVSATSLTFCHRPAPIDYGMERMNLKIFSSPRINETDADHRRYF